MALKLPLSKIMQSNGRRCVLKEKSLTLSVPQGSVAGPILYNAYASTLEVVSPPIDLHGFANDHTMKHSFKPISDEEFGVIHTV